MKFLDLFAGIGGFRMGLENAGHECVGYVEIDKFARKSYEAINNTKGEWTRHDITKVTDAEWRELRGTVELICGGFPCQSFSISGKREGINDTRGTLFFDIIQAAGEIQPRYILLENVKGLLSDRKGETFIAILSSLNELGYDAEWAILNSKNFGVPQNRERVFIIGYPRGECRGQVFPVLSCNKEANGRGIVAGTLTARYPGSQRNGTYIKQIRKQKREGRDRQQYRVYNPEGIAPCLTAKGGGGHEPKITQRPQVDNVKIRKLTPLECWRLQGFPDWAFYRAQKVNSDSQLYKQAGNSVTVPVIEWLGNLL